MAEPLLREPLARALCFLANDGSRSWYECTFQEAHRARADRILARLAAYPEVVEAIGEVLSRDITNEAVAAALFGEPK